MFFCVYDAHKPKQFFNYYPIKVVYHSQVQSQRKDQNFYLRKRFEKMYLTICKKVFKIFFG